MSRRVSPMATELTRSWRGLADDAIAAKAGAEHGQRGQRVAQVAQQRQATPVLVRRAVTARLALLRLEERGIVVPNAVFSLPVGVAEAVARWAGRDPQAAWRHADDYSQERISFQALIDAERLSRKGAIVTRKPRAKLETDPDAWRAEQLRRFSVIDGRRVMPPAPDDLPVHGWTRDGSATPAGILVVGPYDDAQSYMAQRGSHCVTAVGVAKLVGCAIMIVPGDEVRVRYAAWLAERSVSHEEVEIVTVVPTGRPARRKALFAGDGRP